MDESMAHASPLGGETLLVRSRVHSSVGAEGLFSSTNILQTADVGSSELSS